MFRVDMTTGGKEAVIRLSGQLDANSAPELEGRLRAVLPGVDGVELDLRDLAYVSSAGLRELVRAHKALGGRGALRVSNASPVVYEDKYQVCVRVPGTLQIDKLQESWSPED